MYYLLILIKLKLKDVCFLYKALVQNASGMFSAIKKTAFSEKDLHELISNVFLASDSASVNTGLNM